MSDLSNVIPVIAWHLANDATICAKVQQADGSPAIISDYNITLADSYLAVATNPTETCIGVYELDASEGVACFYQTTPMIKSNILIGIDVLSKESNAYARETAILIKDLLHKNMEVSYGGDTYNLMVGNISRTPQYDDAGAFWRHILTIRGTVYYTP